RDIHDGPSARALHRRHYRLHAEEAAVLVDLDVPLPERIVGLHQRGRLVDSGVVDQTVQAAELLSGVDGAGPIGFRGHIVPDERCSRPKLDSQRLALIVQHVADPPLRPLRYQQAGLRGTLAARPATHEHYLVVEACHVHCPDYQRGSLADMTSITNEAVDNLALAAGHVVLAVVNSSDVMMSVA